MDFELTDEQRMFRDEVIRFARAELDADVLDRDARGSFSGEGWRKCAKLGIQGLPVPAEFGGQGADPLTIMLAWRRLATPARTTA